MLTKDCVVRQGTAAQEPQPAQALDTGASFMAAVSDAAAPMPALEAEHAQQQAVLYLPSPAAQVRPLPLPSPMLLHRPGTGSSTRRPATVCEERLLTGYASHTVHQ